MVFGKTELFGDIADNGKSIGEGRATLQTISKENRPEQNAFSDF